MNYKIKRYKPDDIPDFAYKQIFGKKNISKQLGINLCDDDCSYWFVAINNQNVMGFSGLKYSKDCRCCYFKRAYVFPDFRLHGIYTDMYDNRIKMLDKNITTKILANTTKNTNEFYRKRGYKLNKSYKNYTQWVKSIS